MDCRLHVFKRDPLERNTDKPFRFAVLDFNRSKTYPSNFLCMLPLKIDSGKGNLFGALFGDKSLDLALRLLKDALRAESDAEIKVEIERRLKLIDPHQVNLIKCYKCKKTFQPKRVKKYRKNFCDGCLKTRYEIRS
jgi:hypothetical protein